MKLFNGLKKWMSNINPFKTSVTGVPETLASHSNDFRGNWQDSEFFRNVYGGEAEPDSFGLLRDFNHIGSLDYYKLRTRSRQLFTENMYAGMIIDRLVTNIINEGLKLESDPSKLITGMTEEQHIEWTTNTEELFGLWSCDKSVDVEEKHNLKALQRVAFEETLIEGDILVVKKFDKKTGLPKIKLIPGRHVRSLLDIAVVPESGNRILHGVEIDEQGRHVAYHVVKNSDLGIISETERIPAKGRTSNRDTATLIYHKPPPAGRTRGTPLLSRIIQPLAQIGRYSRFELKAAEINAALAMWVEKGEDKPGSNPLGGPTLKADVAEDPEGLKGDLGAQRVVGGTIINELQFGEKPHSFDTKRPNINFPVFKKAILQDIAAALEIPPEILALMFENSFSASRQATIEFKGFVRKERAYFAEQFNKDIYGQWLLGMALNNKIKAASYIQAFKGGDVLTIQGWQKGRWAGYIKQNVDILKEAKAYKEYVDEGFLDRDQASMDLTGSDFQTTARRLKKQNKLLADAREPLLGEINTSISRVERDVVKEKSTDQNQPKQKTPRKTNGIALNRRKLNDEDFNRFLGFLNADVDDDVESVDIDIDSMDNEKELEEA